MTPRKAVLIAFIVFYISTTEIKKVAAFEGIIVNNITDCKTHKCLPKCCNSTDYIDMNIMCIPYSGRLEFDNLTVYTDNIEKSGKSLRDLFLLVPGKFSNITFKGLAYDMTNAGLNVYLTENGIVYLETPNAYRRWMRLETSNFCVDYQQQSSTLGNPKPKIFVVFDYEYIPKSETFYTIALLISCIFLALTLIVYLLLAELRNLCGMVLMAYVASQFGAFLLLSIIQIGDHSISACLGLTFSTYFFCLSCFCWMNIMSIDIWWTFRGYAKARLTHRRGELIKFLIYSIYGWGLPLLITITVAVVNDIDMSHWPWIIKPNIPRNGCFLEGGQKFLYLYVPMLILIVSNWIFFLMTAFNIWRLRHATAVLNSAAAGMPAARRFNRHRFLLYVKLSVIMGISWILEVASSLKPELEIWYITNAYNALIGVSIFIIFVCKRKIKKKLQRRFSEYRGSKKSTLDQSRNNSFTAESSLSRDGTKVNTNPQYTNN